MGLPLYLAAAPEEISWDAPPVPRLGWMACHFSGTGQGLTDLPEQLPPDTLVILDDRNPCTRHSPEAVVRQLMELTRLSGFSGMLLDFQRPPDPGSLAMAEAIVSALSDRCPAAVTAAYAPDRRCPVFLPPAPLHRPLEQYLKPWLGRPIWLEAALCQEEALITPGGCQFRSCQPPRGLRAGLACPELHCLYTADAAPEEVRFTLFDTRQTLPEKLQHAQALGVSRAVGLFQELYPFPSGPLPG